MRTLLAVILSAAVLGVLGQFAVGGATGALVVNLALIAGGVGLLIGGADALVRGAVHLAKFIGVSPFFIGLTVVAFGTSAPELAAAVGATLNDAGELAIGNVLGSNVANICLILGVTAMVRPIMVAKSIIKVDVPLMIVISLAASVVMADELWGGAPLIGKLDGVLLCAGLVSYVAFSAYSGRVDPDEIERDVSIELGETPDQVVERSKGLKAAVINLVLVLLGLGGLILGAQALVTGAVSLAEAAGVSEVVIGLTLVAVGTSIPELAFSIRAATQNHAEIALGNVIGSNVFNLLCVLGVASLVRPIGVPEEAVGRDLWVMLAATILIWPIMITRLKISRIEGSILLVAYAIYIVAVVVQR